jgi:hypothetical protein
VMYYNGSLWTNLGSPGFSAGQVSYTSLAIYNGTPYVAYQDYAHNSNMTVMVYK